MLVVNVSRFDWRAALARQVSERGGDLRCQLAGTRVYISGQAITYLTGKVLLR